MKKCEKCKNEFNSLYRVKYLSKHYYNNDWGFCLSENEKNELPNGKYKAYINSKFKKSFLEVAEAVITGSLKKEILFSSYICHPSMANNELSGPVLLNALLLYLKIKHTVLKAI